MACALLLGAAAQAQIVTSTSRSITREKVKTNTTHYVRVGLNFMNVAGDDAKELDGKVGYDLSWGFQKTLGGKGAYWGMEGGLSSRGYSMKDEGSSWEPYYNPYNPGSGHYVSEKEEEKMIAHNIYYVPFQFGWRFDLGHNISVDPHIGTFISFDYAGKSKYTYTRDGEEEDNESYSLGDLDGWQRVDAGLKFGVGAWYKNFNLDLSYQRGFISAIEDCDAYTSNFQLRLGYAF